MGRDAGTWGVVRCTNRKPELGVGAGLPLGQGRGTGICARGPPRDDAYTRSGPSLGNGCSPLFAGEWSPPGANSIPTKTSLEDWSGPGSSAHTHFVQHQRPAQARDQEGNRLTDLSNLPQMTMESKARDWVPSGDPKAPGSRPQPLGEQGARCAGVRGAGHCCFRSG